MPILDVEIVGAVTHHHQLAQRLADAAGEALESRPEGTWVKLRYLESDAYAENAGTGDVQPVFVSLIQASPPRGADLEAQAAALTEAIAAVTGRPPENVHILFQPPALGRISFGGKLQT